MNEIIGNTTATPVPRSDWAQTDEAKADYIKNKPIVLTEGEVKDLIEEFGGDKQIQADWEQEDEAQRDYIKNKPIPPVTEEDEGKILKVIDKKIVFDELDLATVDKVDHIDATEVTDVVYNQEEGVIVASNYNMTNAETEESYSQGTIDLKMPLKEGENITFTQDDDGFIKINAVAEEIELAPYQTKEDDNLNTISKEVVGAINEIHNILRVTDLTNTTWQLNKNVDVQKDFEFKVDFISDGHDFTSLGTDKYLLYYRSLNYDGTPIYDTYTQVWHKKSRGILTFMGGADITNPTLIDWLYANGEIGSEDLETNNKAIVGAINEVNGKTVDKMCQVNISNDTVELEGNGIKVMGNGVISLGEDQEGLNVPIEYNIPISAGENLSLNYDETSNSIQIDIGEEMINTINECDAKSANKITRYESSVGDKRKISEVGSDGITWEEMGRFTFENKETSDQFTESLNVPIVAGEGISLKISNDKKTVKIDADLTSYQTKEDKHLETNSQTVVDAINEVNDKTVDNIGLIDACAGEDKDVGIYDQGVYWYNQAVIKNDDGKVLKDSIEIIHKIPVIAGRNVTLEVDGDKGLVTINAEGGGEIADLSSYQTRVDEGLKTNSKEVVGAINELIGDIGDGESSTHQNIMGVAWVMHETINLQIAEGESIKHKFEFTSNGEKFNTLTYSYEYIEEEDLRKCKLRYCNYNENEELENRITVYEYTHDKGTWIDEAYRTIYTHNLEIELEEEIAVKNSDVKFGDRFNNDMSVIGNWIEDLSVQQALLGFAWVFPDDFNGVAVDGGEFVRELKFKSNGRTFDKLYFTQDPICLEYEEKKGEDRVRVYDSIDGWKKEEYKTIYTYDFDVSFEELNAERDDTVTFGNRWENFCQTISNKTVGAAWIMKDVLTYDTKIEETVDFNSAGHKFNQIIYEPNVDGSGVYRLTYYINDGDEQRAVPVYEGNIDGGDWLDDRYKTIYTYDLAVDFSGIATLDESATIWAKLVDLINRTPDFATAWKFKKDLNGQSCIQTFDFESNGQAFKQLYLGPSDGSETVLYYYRTLEDSAPIEVYRDGEWIDNDYRTIFTNDLDISFGEEIATEAKSAVFQRVLYKLDTGIESTVEWIKNFIKSLGDAFARLIQWFGGIEWELDEGLFKKERAAMWNMRSAAPEGEIETYALIETEDDFYDMDFTSNGNSYKRIKCTRNKSNGDIVHIEYVTTTNGTDGVVVYSEENGIGKLAPEYKKINTNRVDVPLDFANRLSSEISNLLGSSWDAVCQFVTDIKDKITKFFKGDFSVFTDGWAEKFTGLFSEDGILAKVQEKVNTILPFFQNNGSGDLSLDNLKNKLSGFFGSKELEQAVSDLRTQLTTLQNSVQTLQEAMTDIADLRMDVGSKDDLTTLTKTSLIGALNEVNYNVNTVRDIIKAPLTDLTDTTWFIPAGWQGDFGIGRYLVNCTIGGSTATEMGIGYEAFIEITSGDIVGDDGVAIPGKQSVKFRVASDTIGFDISPIGKNQVWNAKNIPVTLTFTGGDDVTNPKLIAWLEKYGQMEGATGLETEDQTIFGAINELNAKIPHNKESKGLSYILNDDGQGYSVTGIGTCTDTDLIIPSEYNGLPVTSIGYNAFFYCSTLNSVVIPDSVTSIDALAFSHCQNLSSVVIGNSVATIGDSAFNACIILESVVIPDSVKSIGEKAFRNCESLKYVTMGSHVNVIGSGAFQNCRSLQQIYIPGSVMSIGEDVFVSCIYLVIYCAVDSPIGGWASNWNSENRTVIWGAKNDFFGVNAVINKINQNISNLATVDKVGYINIASPSYIYSFENGLFWTSSYTMMDSAASQTYSSGNTDIKIPLIAGENVNFEIDGNVVKVNAEVDTSNLQPKTDNTLTTTSKEIVGAINEVNRKVGEGVDSSKAIIDVVELPTENIDTNNSYRVPIGTLFAAGKKTSWVCIMVETLPSEGEPASSDMVNFTLYYETTSNSVSGYVNETLGSAFGVPMGWYPIETLAQIIGAQWNGIVFEESNISEIGVSLLIGYKLYQYKNGWHNVGDGVGWSGTGYGAEVFNRKSNIASGEYSHAEGNLTQARGNGSHAEGGDTAAEGSLSHAEGNLTYAKGRASHAEGIETIASGEAQHVQGRNNVEDTENKYAHIVGNGESNPSNAHTIDWQGNAWFAGEVKIGGTGQDDENAKELATETYVDNKVAELSAEDVEALPLSGGVMTGEIQIGQGDGKGIQLGTNGRINATVGTNKNATMFGVSNGNYYLGHSGFKTLMRGSATRPSYNNNDLALYSDISNLQTKTDETLETESKEIVGAINEVNAKIGTGNGSVDLSSYQTKEDEALVTTSKEIVGAINELSEKMGDADNSVGPILTNGSIGLKYALYDEYAELIGLGECTDTIVEVASMVQGLYVTAIGDNAFDGGDYVEEVMLPKRLSYIGAEAFSGCANIEKLSYKGTTNLWKSIEKNESWLGVSEIYEVYCIDDILSLYSQGLAYALSNNGQSYSVSGIGTCADADLIIPRTYLGLPVTGSSFNAFYENQHITSLILPNTMTSIGNSSFQRCSSLTNVFIPDSVKSIGNQSFSGCSSILSITIPNSVTTLDYGAFSNCTLLTSVTLGDSVTSIGDYAFSRCISLTSIVISDSVTNISGDAFYNCKSLTDVYYTGGEAQWNSINIGAGNGSLLNATIHYNWKEV